MTCAKCGKNSAGPKWHDKAASEFGGERCGVMDHTRNRAEHLHYYCVCGYDWITSTVEQFRTRSGSETP